MFVFFFELSNSMIPIVLVIAGLFVPAVPTAIFSSIPEIIKKPQLLGLGMAVLAIGQNLGMFVGPTVIGGVMESHGWLIAGYSLAAISLIGIITGLFAKVR